MTQNFQTVDRFLETPGSVTTSAQLNQIGRTEERFILRRNAGEENNWIFLNWERVELALGGALFLLLLFGSRPQKLNARVLCGDASDRDGRAFPSRAANRRDRPQGG